MARKTFISYKYSESQDLRDEIIKKLGEDASYYQGETANSPDLTDESTESIKEKLKGMMFSTSVTIVILSPNMKNSKWIDWEIEYCLKEITRNERTSKANGLVAVVKKIDGKYDWLVDKTISDDGCSVRQIKTNMLFDIINKNRFNRIDASHTCSHCKTFNQLKDSYVSIVDEDSFLSDPNKYIENAFEKSASAKDFKLVKLRP